MALPVINFNQLHDPKELMKLREASVEWGCFRLLNQNIPLMSEMQIVVKYLLDLPMEIKKKNKDVGSILGTGYLPPDQTNPLYETMGLYDFGSSQAVDNFCSLLNASSYQRGVIQNYAAAIHHLIVDLAQKVGRSLGSEREFLKGWVCWFRINKFNFSPETVGATGTQLHTDSGFLTIVQGDGSVGGLEVVDKHSGAYIPLSRKSPSQSRRHWCGAMGGSITFRTSDLQGGNCSDLHSFLSIRSKGGSTGSFPRICGRRPSL